MSIFVIDRKAIYLILIFSIFLSCGEKASQPKSKIEYPTTQAFKDYQNLRLKELENNITSPGTLPQLGANDVIALVMDWNLGQNRYATLSIFRDGRTKIFTSTGAKKIDIKHQNVNNEVGRLMEYASTLIPNAKRLKNTRLPEEGHFTFYFKTNQGSSMGEGHLDDIESGTSYWGDLFKQSNDVIMEVRATYRDFGNSPE